MISVANRIYVHADHRTQFEERFTNRARLVDGMPGFLFNQLLRPTADDDPYIVLTFWQSREDFDRWVGSAEFREGHARSRTLPREAFTQPSHVELHEVILDSRDPELVPEAPGAPVIAHG